MSGEFIPNPVYRPGHSAPEAVLPYGGYKIELCDPFLEPVAAPFDYFIDPTDDYSVARDVATGYERAWARQQEAIVREMLGRWVSELEPCLIVRDTHVVGIGMAGDPEGKIIVRPAPVRYDPRARPLSAKAVLP